MKARIAKSLALILIALQISCDRPSCQNTNPIFDKFEPQSNEYKYELAAQIRSVGFENLDYWFDRYLNENGKEFIEIYIQGKSLCAKSVVEVNDWSKIETLRKKVNGFHGAKLNGFQMRIEQIGKETHFIFEDVENIVD